MTKIGADTAENEQHFAEICQPTLSDVSDVSRPALPVHLRGWKREILLPAPAIRTRDGVDP